MDENIENSIKTTFWLETGENWLSNALVLSVQHYFDPKLN